MNNINIVSMLGAAPIGALLALIMSAGTAIAEELDGPAVKKLISGNTVRLNTPFGIALPLRYRADGVVVGDVSGISAASMFAPKEEGRWWIEGGALCQRWPTWYKGRQFCFTITALGGDRISWVRDDGAKGTARVGG
jgi:hypothetical protein